MSEDRCPRVSRPRLSRLRGGVRVTLAGQVLAVALQSGSVLAQTVAPAAVPTLAEQAAARFPQPVRVGSLIGRRVLQPIESQPVLGRVEAIARRGDGGFDMVIGLGGFLGFGARPIRVPVEAVSLLGTYVAMTGFTPEQLNAFPTVAGWDADALAAESVIRVGLVRPFH